MFFWCQKTGVKLHLTQPGKPTQNAFVESFKGKFRDGCLNQHWFLNLDDARDIIDQWRNHYNEVKPNSSLSYAPPGIYENKQPEMINFFSQKMATLGEKVNSY